jgi:hypothetical protein
MRFTLNAASYRRCRNLFVRTESGFFQNAESVCELHSQAHWVTFHGSSRQLSALSSTFIFRLEMFVVARFEGYFSEKIL